MNSKTLLAVAAFATLAAGAARADDITVDNNAFVSSRTRAEVQADLTQYKKAGVNPWSTSYNPVARFHSGVSREMVKADYRASRDEVAAMNSEDSGSAYLAQVAGTRVVGTTLAGMPVNPQ